MTSKTSCEKSDEQVPAVETIVPELLTSKRDGQVVRSRNADALAAQPIWSGARAGQDWRGCSLSTLGVPPLVRGRTKEEPGG